MNPALHDPGAASRRNTTAMVPQASASAPGKVRPSPRPIRSQVLSQARTGHSELRIHRFSMQIILFGEHAVVYGYRAVAAALSDLRVHVEAVSSTSMSWSGACARRCVEMRLTTILHLHARCPLDRASTPPQARYSSALKT